MYTTNWGDYRLVMKSLKEYFVHSQIYGLFSFVLGIGYEKLPTIIKLADTKYEVLTRSPLSLSYGLY